ncbi:HORMA domain-containing protein [Jimgerdemannia flammicorona]|uniref:HORMA domain-containing protein n=1 Tax=Jimgerdemannia flammicorona TaxID=994334 RepID=A0A433DEK8_9FUNG|nr:HORMA domain-containing protein [Jimgerdemannia flammicorona]
MPTTLAQLHPRQRVDTETVTQQQSLQVVRKVLATSLGCITYLRSLFPEENYEDESVGNISLKTLKRGYSQEADKLLDWLETGIFDALNRHYLRAFILGIHLDPKHPNRLAECYTFKIAYPDGEPQMCIERSGEDSQSTEVWDSADVFSRMRGTGGNGVEGKPCRTITVGEVKKSVQQLLRRLILLTQTLKPLPDNRFITMKLYYYENITPPDYEPPFFRPGSAAPEDRFAFETKPEKIQVGEVETPYHTLTLGIQTVTDTFEIPDEDYIATLADQNATAEASQETQTVGLDSQPESQAQGPHAGSWSQGSTQTSLSNGKDNVVENEKIVLWNAEEEIDEGEAEAEGEGKDEGQGEGEGQGGLPSVNDAMIGDDGGQVHNALYGLNASQLSTVPTVPLGTQCSVSTLTGISKMPIGSSSLFPEDSTLIELQDCDSDGDVSMSFAEDTAKMANYASPFLPY